MSNNFNQDFLNLSIHEDEFEGNAQPLNPNPFLSPVLPPDLEDIQLTKKNEELAAHSTFSKNQISKLDSLQDQRSESNEEENSHKKKVLLKKQSSMRSAESQDQTQAQSQTRSHIQSQTQPVEETKEYPPPTRRHRFAQRRKFDAEEVKEGLKKLKMTMQEENKAGEETPILVRYQRKYTEQAKEKALELASQIGPRLVSGKTGIPESTIRRWQKNGLKRLGTSGRHPLYPEIETDLMKIFRDARSNGILITNSTLLTEARQIAVRLKVKDFVGTYSWLSRFKDRNKICYRKTTRTGQKLPPTAEKECEEFKERIIQLCEKNRYPLEAVVNLDESGIFFDAPSGQTLEFRGKKEILVQTTGSEKIRLTALVSVTALNEFLPLFAVVKGKKIPKEVQDIEQEDLIVASNPSAWINEEAFLIWIDRVWRPYSQSFNRSLLILDQFRVHKLSVVLAKLEELRTDVVFVPRGMTFFYQPVDVFVNKPLKQGVKKRWEAYMYEQSQQDPERFKKPTKQDVLIWIKESLGDITLGENVFFNTILRDYDFTDAAMDISDGFEDIHPQEEDDYDLIIEEDYDYEPL